ncbi:DUF5643 domain-containing protein [Paenibacillus brasilensis]|uniref:RNA polymerase sigma factor (Sigma-70 family) n=1 Tax=Paenibacillus brasilensis TaxID=128574 RepID=A0ABU0L233_9BACL|nr:DUF5643 domain-containing protein [Paenibacillus brasilensis]MDQ0494528.1 RNA polymerase sigma factor (sigma-70 family) [Paenibacillus brasilensis]
MNLELKLHQARHGDRKAFVALMKHMESDMYGMARSILRSNEDCADAMQEAMLKAYKSLGELREPRYFKTWLLRILINECHLILRKQKRVVPVAEFIREPSTSGGYEKIDLFINGKSMLSQNGVFSYLGESPGRDSNSMLISYMRDPASGLPALPEQFDLKVYAKLKGVTKPFELKTIVYKTKLDNKVLKPQISKANTYLKFTVNRVEMTPVTTKILTTFTMLVDLKDMPDDYAEERKYISTEGPHKNYTKKVVKSLDYAVFDDQGRELEMLRGTGKTLSKNQPGQMVMLFTPFVDPPKKITFKPFIHPLTPDGRAILDANGHWSRQYLPEFEITIDVPKNTNHK